MVTYLEFEKPIAELRSRATELRAVNGADVSGEADRVDAKADVLLRETYTRLTPWQKAQVARHPDRPHFYDYVERIFTDFLPLAGDRAFGDDQAILGGFATLEGVRVIVIGHEKGRDTASRVRHNFGMGKPEGYRKAIRLMELADRFGLPVVTLVDTSGAFPGVQAEERGQAEAIARSTEACLSLRVPMIAVIVGEGGSGGAIALAAANRVLMLEHAIYAVISPEGCASILWRNADCAPEAAEAMRVTADHLLRLGVIDAKIEEPVGGAHRDLDAAARAVQAMLVRQLEELQRLDATALRTQRRAKFMAMGTV